MAKSPTFQTIDIERLFKALLPSAVEDPFGRLESQNIDLLENHEREAVRFDEFDKKISDELADIKTRTFGILALQVFKAIKFFFGILPQGRIILLVVAGLALVNTLLSDGKISASAIRDAVKATGLSDFVDKVIAELKKFVNELAANISEISDLASTIFARLEFDADAILVEARNLDINLNLIDQNLTSRPDLAGIQLDQARQNLNVILSRGLAASNVAGNAADIVGPILRGFDDQIRTIPALALKAVRLGD